MSTTFGITITAQDIIDQASFFDDWEEKYAFIIDLGKQLEAFPEDKKSDDTLVKGCQSLVWIDASTQDDVLTFRAESDAIIVKGLLAVILAAYNHKSPQEILTFDIEEYFTSLDLLSHISNVRGNGVQAMVERIKAVATQQLS